MESKLLLSQMYIDYFRKLYESFKTETGYEEAFDEVFESNTSRLKFINMVFDCVGKKNLSDEFVKLFYESLDVFKRYIDGSCEHAISVPVHFRNDEEGCYIPTELELRFLFGLMKICCDFHKAVYDDKDFALELPDGTLNQNITKLFSIKRENLPHILGLTEHEDKGNYLFKYFLQKDKSENPNLYTTEKGQPLANGQKVSERYLEWLLSEYGQDEIIYINQCIRILMETDEKMNPQNYANGRPKSKARFDQLVYDTFGFHFPMIKFSRYVCKTVNLLNFLNMNNTSEMILDYNAQIGEAIPQDMFFVNAASDDLLNNSKKYANFKVLLRELLLKYGSDDEKARREAVETFRQLGIKVNTNGEDTIASWANLLRTDEFVGSKGIEPALSGTKQSVLSSLSDLFPNDVHLLGFGSTLEEKDESGQVISRLFGIDESVMDRTYCGTSIAVTLPEYLDKFNIRGRCFFLDKFNEPGGVSGGHFYVSAPLEEENFLRRQILLGFDSYAELRALLAENERFYSNFGDALTSEEFGYKLLVGMEEISNKTNDNSTLSVIAFYNDELKALFDCFYRGAVYEPRSYNNGNSHVTKK